jgi:chromate reductase, NAD(P)H dehydrogenase (quinone)
MLDYETKDETKVLAIAGSLRDGSFNRALLRAAGEIAPAGMVVEIFSLTGIPPFNRDVERGGDPEAVAGLKQAIRDSDALLIATPEYQWGLPGVLKNALDWASRPSSSSVLRDKPVAIMGATPGPWGTARAQAQLREALSLSRARVVPRPEVLVARAYELIDSDGRLVDASTRQHIAMLLRSLTDVARLFGRTPADTRPWTGQVFQTAASRN